MSVWIARKIWQTLDNYRSEPSNQTVQHRTSEFSGHHYYLWVCFWTFPEKVLSDKFWQLSLDKLKFKKKIPCKFKSHIKLYKTLAGSGFRVGKHFYVMTLKTTKSYHNNFSKLHCKIKWKYHKLLIPGCKGESWPEKKQVLMPGWPNLSWVNRGCSTYKWQL